MHSITHCLANDSTLTAPLSNLTQPVHLLGVEAIKLLQLVVNKKEKCKCGIMWGWL